MSVWRHNAKRNWRTNLAFLIAGKDLYDWRSKHNRIVAAMSRSMTEARIIKLLKELDTFGEIDTAFVPELIALIEKGEQQ